MRKHSFSRFFTLIELLVVIAIIGILASMLMPSLISAMESARTAQCINNLRQTGVVFTMYADSYDNYYPAQENPNSPAVWTPVLNWGQRLAVFNAPEAQAAFTSGTNDEKTAALGIFRCPSCKYQNIGVVATSQIYGMNPCLTGVYSTRYPIKRDQIGKTVSSRIPLNSPSKTIIVADSLYAGASATVATAANLIQINRINSYDGAAVIRHNNLCNVLLLDSSARSTNMATLLDEMKCSYVSDRGGNIYQ